MALIIEDGTMPQGANCYISLEDADAYLTARNLWAATELGDIDTPTKKETAIIRAADYLNTLKWLGSKVDMHRLLAFPRAGALDYDSVETPYVPQAVAIANAELAALFFAGTDLLAPQQKGILAQTETVDVISTSTTYESGSPTQAYYQSVVGILRPYLASVDGESMNVSMGKVLRG